MYAPPTKRDLVAVVVTVRLSAVSVEDPTDGIGRDEGITVESTGEVLDGAPVYLTRTEDGWQSITWRDPSGVRVFVASRDLDAPGLIKLAESLRPATKEEVQKAIVPYDPSRPRSDQVSGIAEDSPPPSLVPEEPDAEQE